MIVTFLLTGARLREIVHLDRGDIDLINRRFGCIAKAEKRNNEVGPSVNRAPRGLLLSIRPDGTTRAKSLLCQGTRSNLGPHLRGPL